MTRSRTHRPKGAQPGFWLGLGLAILAALAIGCAPPEDDTFRPEAPVAISFDGATDPTYVGDWATANKNSSLTLKEDGEATMVNIAVGRGTSKVEGEWKVSTGNLLFKVNDQVTRYVAKLDGEKLRLQNKASKLDVVYLRVKK